MDTGSGQNLAAIVVFILRHVNKNKAPLESAGVRCSENSCSRYADIQLDLLIPKIGLQKLKCSFFLLTCFMFIFELAAITDNRRIDIGREIVWTVSVTIKISKFIYRFSLKSLTGTQTSIITKLNLIIIS